MCRNERPFCSKTLELLARAEGAQKQKQNQHQNSSLTNRLVRKRRTVASRVLFLVLRHLLSRTDCSFLSLNELLRQSAMTPPLVSTRLSLAWPPSPPSETTNTLVLTGRTGTFLDLRVFISGSRRGAIDWATAGEKSYLPDSTPGPSPPHPPPFSSNLSSSEHPKAQFVALLDNRSPSSSTPSIPPPPDEGLFTALPNGDVLETGSMANPDAGGAVQLYEEVWRRYEIDEDVRSVFLQSVEGNFWVGRIGEHEIGMGEVGEGFAAWRWERRQGEWEEVYAIGEVGVLPRIPEEGIVEEQGERIELGGRSWIVRENS